MIGWLLKAIMPACNQLQEPLMPYVSPEYQMKELTYRTKEDQHFTVFVVAKSAAEYKQHMENFRRAGLEPVEGHEVVAVKLEQVEEKISFAKILKSE